ncbi:MAG: hypothetical protein IKB03_00490 [Tidjanibacter sp.]|nr:hypothetical protein [Tidjanibacter sp.]
MSSYYLPDDISIEELMAYLPADSYRLAVDGTHKRSVYKDIHSYQEGADGKLIIKVGRKGIYDSLPEYLFHPINRFDYITERNKEAAFSQECDKQEREVTNARNYFAVVDKLLLELRMRIRTQIIPYAADNKVIQDLIADDLTDEESNNPYIKKTLHFLPQCKNIRGDSTLLTLMLRKILVDERIILSIDRVDTTVVDDIPDYRCNLDSSLSSLYLGNVFEESVHTYSLKYWPGNYQSEAFAEFLASIELFREFIQSYFLSVESVLVFNIESEEDRVVLSDDETNIYLNYNSNI